MYINHTTQQKELFDNLKTQNKNISLPPNGTAIILDDWYYINSVTAPAYDRYTQKLAEQPPVFDGTQYNQVWLVEDLTGQDAIDSLARLQQDKYNLVTSTVDELIRKQCREEGYDNENSIAKYLVPANPFYAQCESLSLWIGSVWAKVVEVQEQAQAGTISEPTIDELLAMLPQRVI